jgi:CheY-like chemotaxis protein
MQANSDIGPADHHDAPSALVAEDDVLLRLALSEYLRDAGFHVLEAANGDEAQKIMGAPVRVDIVISDVHMARDGEGLDLARWLAVNYPDIPMILTSGSQGVAQSPALAACLNAVFVPKPYVEREMERLARARLRSRGASCK